MISVTIELDLLNDLKEYILDYKVRVSEDIITYKGYSQEKSFQQDIDVAEEILDWVNTWLERGEKSDINSTVDCEG